MLEDEVCAFAEKHAMFPRDCSALVAVSGGPDSVALLHCLDELRSVMGVRLAVCHVNHQLRGDDSEADAAFVEELAGSLDLPFVCTRVDVAERAGGTGESTEMAARELRRAALADAARRNGADRIALGHTAGDSVETILLNILRGTGVRGLAGIRPVSPEGLVRPLLSSTRAQVLAYLEGGGHSYREDATNEDLTHLRNRVRHGLIPLLQAFDGPSITDALQRLSETARLDDEALRLAGQGWLAEALVEEGESQSDECTLSLEVMDGLPRGAAFLLLRRACERVRGHTFGLERLHLREVLRLAASGRVHARVRLPIGITAEVGRGVLRLFVDEGPQGGGQPASVHKAAIRVPGRTEEPALGVVVQTAWAEDAGPGGAAGSGEEAVLWCSERPPRWFVRFWREGDRVRPKGMQGHSKKIKKLFREMQVPPDLRRRYPLLVDASDEPLWIPGIALSEEANHTGHASIGVHVRLVWEQ
jgi:tRNA(Ile)-lysidine synthase